MAKKHAKKSENFNEDLLRYIMDSVYYTGEGEGDDEDAGVRPEPYRPLLADAKTYREGRNRLIKKIQDDGNIDFLLPAIEAYNYDYGNPEAGIVYGPESFDASKLKKEPIDVRSMDLADVDAASSAIADFLGMNDNGDKERGKLEALLKAYYAGEKGALQNLADAHAGDYDLYRESRALSDALRGKIETNHAEKARLYRMLGITPDTDIEEVLNIDRGLPAYAQRSYRAYARKKDTPAKAVSLLEGMLVAPQMAEKWDKGLEPQLHDVGTDLAETTALGYLKAGKPVVKGLGGAGVTGVSDLVHDAIDDYVNEKVYSRGEFPDSGRDYSDLDDPSRLYGPAIMWLFGFGGRGLGRRISGKVDRMAQKSADKVAKIEKEAQETATKAAENVSEIASRKQEAVQKLTNARTALEKIEEVERKYANSSFKPMGLGKLKEKKAKLKETIEEARGILAETDIDQKAAERTAEKALQSSSRKIKAEQAKQSAIASIANVGVNRMLYGPYSRDMTKNAWNVMMRMGSQGQD